MSELTTVTDPLERDRYGRPMVTPPGGGKKIAYTRATTFVDCIEDKYNLGLWQQRMVILGLVDRPDLLLSAAAHRDDNKQLNRIAADAAEASKAHAKATIGTALHALAEQHDRGQELRSIPDEYCRDLNAYVAATKPLTPLEIERFTVLDDLKIGGTPDRIVEYDGEKYIADLKTGSIEFGALKIAMQLAVYSRSVIYNHDGTRTPLPGVNGDRGIVIHLPAGTGTCSLHWVNIKAGWKAVQIAAQVREWRGRKGLLAALEQPTSPVADEMDDVATAASIEAEIGAAVTVDDLTAVWAKHQAVWLPEHTELAAAKKALLNSGLIPA